MTFWPAGTSTPGRHPQEVSEFLHLASAAICEEASADSVPAFEMAETNPIAVAAVHGDVNRALFVGIGSRSKREAAAQWTIPWTFTHPQTGLSLG